jgi:hypothetical protein
LAQFTRSSMEFDEHKPGRRTAIAAFVLPRDPEGDRRCDRPCGEDRRRQGGRNPGLGTAVRSRGVRHRARTGRAATPRPARANALGDTLTFQAPPERPITFDWPDAVRVDGALVGGVRLLWPEGSEDEVPDWVVFGATIRTAVMRAGESGLRPLLGGLDEEGFEGISPAAVIDGWTRYFLREMDRWNEYGFDGARERWLERTAGTAFAILDNGDFLDDTGKRSLAAELRTPSWLDPATGAPWI